MSSQRLTQGTSAVPFYEHRMDVSPREAEAILWSRIDMIPEGKRLHDAFESVGGTVLFQDTGRNTAALLTTSTCKDGRYVRCNGEDASAPQIIIAKPFFASHPGFPYAVLHELQHFEQYQNDVMYCAGKHLPPRDMAIYQRVVEADAEANACVNSLKLKLAGNPIPYDFNVVSGCGLLGPVSGAEELFRKAPESLHDGRLKRMFFDACFRGTALRRQYDSEVAQAKWNRLDDYFRECANPPPHARLERGDLEKVGDAQAEGINYLTLPGFRPIDHHFYRKGFTPANQRRLTVMGHEWRWGLGRS